MDLVIFIIVLVVVVALLMWAVYYIPFPPGSPVFLKNLLYVLILLCAVIAIVYRLGVLHA